MPTIDEAVVLSIREMSIIPFISLVKNEKNEKKYLVTIRLSSSATWLLHVACFNCDDAHNVLFCCFPLRTFFCVSFFVIPCH